MDIGLYASTHGLGYRDAVNFLARSVSAQHMQIICVFDCPSGQRQELEDQMRQFSEQVPPHTAGIRAEGGWKTGL